MRVGGVPPRVEDHDQAGMAQPGHQAYLTAAAHVGVGQHAALVEDLDRHRAVEHGVAGAEHLGHAAAAEQLADDVPPTENGRLDEGHRIAVPRPGSPQTGQSAISRPATLCGRGLARARRSRKVSTT